MSIFTIAGYTLAGLWAAGTLGVMVYMISALAGDVVGKLVGHAIGIPIWVLLGLGPIAVVHHESGPSFELLRPEWACTATHVETTTTYIQSGNVMVPSTTSHTVCDAYARAAQ